MKTSSQAVLLVHGLGGTAYDLGALGRTLEEAGYVTHTPLLPGHGSNPEDLKATRWQDWVGAIEQEYHRLSQQYTRVHLAGICLGALVALEVARRVKLDGQLMLYAPPMFLDGWGLPRLTWARHIVYRLPRLLARMRVPEQEPFGIKNARIRRAIQQRFASGDRFHYPYIPLATVREVDRLRAQLKPRLAEIRCRTLIVHAHEDEITSLRSARYLQKRLGGRCELMELSNSYHMVMVDNERGAVLQRSRAFLQDTAGLSLAA